MYSESYILGYLTRSFGLTPDDIQKIITGNLTLDKSPEEIRDFILNNCIYKITLLRHFYNLGMNIYDIANLFQVDLNIMTQNIDNFSYWINYIDFRAKMNIEIRRRILSYLETQNISYNKIAEILNVSISTIQNDRLSLIK